MSHPDCPRQIVFTLPGAPAVEIRATEVNGTIEFVVDVLDTFESTGDLRALYFHIDPSEFPGLTVTSTGSSQWLTEYRIGNNSILDLGDGATLAGKVKSGFDVGIEWGTSGGKKDNINFPVDFTLSNLTGNLTLDDLGGMLFGAKLDSVGGPGSTKGAATKLTTIAPYAPDAIDDVYNMYEDGAADLNSPSKNPAAVTIDVLANDTDGDTAQSAFIIDDIVEGPLHGSIEISADGRYIYYTPDLDYSGTDSFWYCMSDGQGGQDSALCTINIAAVADVPIVTFAVAQGSHINETLVTVTATQDDADGSEDLTSLDWAVQGGTPLGVTITPLGPIANAGDQLVQQFVVTTGAEMDWNFDIDFTGVSTESSNADTESNTETQNIEIDYTSNFDTLTYEVVDQSIWSTGDEFVFDYEDFLGINEGISVDIGDDDITGTFIKANASIKAGFDIDVHFEGGQIDASIPVDVTINTTYNKTTDTVYIEPWAALGSGGSFTTTGPEGSAMLDFIFEAAANLHVSLAWFDVYNDGFDDDRSQNIFDFDSEDAAQVYTILGGLVDIGFEWPHISVTGETSGSGASNDFLFMTLDVDQLANFLLGGALSFLDADPTDPDNFELLDFDVTGGLNFIQDFALGLASTATTLVLEDGTEFAMTFGTPMMIGNVSAYDANDDGFVEFDFALDPNVTLTNETSLGGNIDADLWLAKNFDIGGYHKHFDIVEGEIVELFNDTFALTGVGSAAADFLI